MNAIPQNAWRPVDAFILAGGASSRMGTDKALLSFGNLTLIERAICLLESVGLSPRIVGTRADLAGYAPVVADLREGCGPLSGIEAGLIATKGAAALFLPVDIPFMPARLLDCLLERSAVTAAAATIPRILGQAQPLCAVYRPELLPAVSASLRAGDYKVMRVVQQGAEALGTGTDLFDVELAMTASGGFAGWPAIPAHGFLNCNSPEDLGRAGRLVSPDRLQ